MTTAMPCLSAPCVSAVLPGGWRAARPAVVRPLAACHAAAGAVAAVRTAAVSSPAPAPRDCGLRTRAPCVARPPPHQQQQHQQRRPLSSAALPELIATAATSPFRDYYVLAFAFVGAFIWVKFFDLLAANNVLEQKLSRKIVHTTTGPLFVLTWPLFSAAPLAKLLAAAVPVANGIRLMAVGTGVMPDPGLVKSVSRSGDSTELLRGPLYYCVVLVAATLLTWRDNPAGLIAIALMCGGDGLADIVGRRLGATASAKLPYNPNKSYAGSAAMFLGGLVMSVGLVQLFCSLGFFACYSSVQLWPALATISAVATLVESLPINQVLDDNLSVPGVAAAMSMLLLPPQAVALAAGAPLGLPL